MICWGRRARASHHHAVEISNLPGLTVRITAEVWNQMQMQMQMPSPSSKHRHA
jgi:hypothetical protein